VGSSPQQSVPPDCGDWPIATPPEAALPRGLGSQPQRNNIDGVLIVRRSAVFQDNSRLFKNMTMLSFHVSTSILPASPQARR